MQETIGQRLKREREARYLTLEKASADTRIRTVFLKALEADDYSVMPSAAQGRGFLRNYADYLDINIDEWIAEIQRNPIPPEQVSGPLPQVNLQEMEIPSLTESAEEKPAPQKRTRLLKRKPKAESTPSTPEENQPEEKPKTPTAEESEVQPAAEIPHEEPGQVPAEEEAKQGFFARVVDAFKARTQKKDSLPTVDIPEEVKVKLPPQQPAQPDKPADAIMVEIGGRLRERREMISLTMDEVERHTRLRAAFVKALEEGAFDKLPSTVQTRGMLANYATFLDLDVDAILLRYADALQARRREKYSETPRENIQTQVKASMPPLRMFIASDLIFGFVMIAVLVALAVWGVGRIVSTQEAAVPTPLPLVDVLASAPVPTASLESTFVAVDDPSVATSASSSEVVSTEEVATTSNANVTVSLFALERVFVKISVDGKDVFEGRMAPRETKVYEAEDQVVILTGNGSALRITYNGRDLGLMGGVGEVVNRVYLITGVATPTATLSPTPTNTPLTTPTFTPTFTPTPTATSTASQ